MAGPEQKRRDKAKETLDIYAPLAHRLGIRTVKEELEDLSLRILDPIAYQEIEEALALREGERTAFLESIKERIRERLAEYGLKLYVEGRHQKHHGDLPQDVRSRPRLSMRFMTCMPSG